MAKVRWIEGAALEVVLAMKEVRPGDKVRIAPTEERKPGRTHHAEYRWDPRDVWTVLSVDDDSMHPINLAPRMRKDPHDWIECCGYHHIKAWRRP